MTKSKMTENPKWMWYEQAGTLMNSSWTMNARNIRGDQNGEIQYA